MGLKEVVNQILSSCSDIKHEEVLQMIKNKKKDSGNFLTDETAARLVASDLGVKIQKRPARLKIQIKDLVSGLNDVSLTGQVMSVYPPKTFKRRDWTEGKLASILVSDNTGKVRAVLWDKKVKIIEKGKIQQEQTIRISHAYVRQGLDGNPELHVGDKGNIKILTEPTKKLSEITNACGPITVEGTVNTTPELKEVTTSRNEKVMVAVFELSDETGKLRVSAWRNVADAAKELTVGTKIRLRNMYAKAGYENKMELSSRYSTKLEVITQQSGS